MKFNSDLMVRVIAVVGISVSLGGLNASAIDTQRWGIADMQRALQSVESGKKAKTQLEKEFNAKKKELQTEEAAIKKTTEDFKKQASVMNEDARGKKQADLQERIFKFQEKTSRSQQEITQKEHDLTFPIITKLKTIAEEVRKKRAYSGIIQKEAVIASDEKDDVTDDMIAEFDKQSKAK